MGQSQKFSISCTPEIYIHVILHEEGAMVDGRPLIKCLNHKLVLLKPREHFNHTLLDKEQGISRGVLCQQYIVLFQHSRLQTEHQVEQDLVTMLRQVFHPLEHLKNE